MPADDDLIRAIERLTAAVEELTATIRGGSTEPVFSRAPALAKLAVVMTRSASASGFVNASQLQLALLSGLAEVTVQRLLKQLAEDGIVRTKYRRIEIMQLDQLQEIAKGVVPS